MNPELTNFAARLREIISSGGEISLPDFNSLALELFALQFNNNAAYRTICVARGLTPATVEHWTRVPAVPTAAFKELELSCLSPGERTAVFHSSGTTEQKPSRHFHGVESLALYEAALWRWFEPNFCPGLSAGEVGWIFLTPPPALAPHSSLVHMFETVRQAVDAPHSAFTGRLDETGAWAVDFEAALAALNTGAKPKMVLGTAFSFVHLADFMAEKNRECRLPAGSRVMETGGYKNRSRTLPKAELHALITERLGVGRADIICEYGMSELSSQAYDAGTRERIAEGVRVFHFPPWVQAQVISPETGRAVAEGETGLIRIFDLANVFSVAAVQTEDLGVRRGGGFELAGRAAAAEARGCSLMTA